MKTVMQFLSLLLCLELIIGPVRGSLLISSAMAQEDQTCPVGQSWDNSVNRCLTKAEVIKVNNATQLCGENKDCYKNNAQNALKAGDQKDQSSIAGDNSSLYKKDGSGKQKLGIAIGNGVAVGLPLLIATSVLLAKAEAKKGISGLNKAKAEGAKDLKYSCNPNSLILMYAAAAALGAGEIIGYFNHKAKLNAIQKEWDKSVVPKSDEGADKKQENATEAQSQAFEFLAQNEDQVAKTTRLKKGFYLAATSLFATASAAAVFEKLQLTKARLLVSTPPVDAAGVLAREEAKKTISRLTCSTENVNNEADKKSDEILETEKAKEKKLEADSKNEAEMNAREKDYKEKSKALTEDFSKAEDAFKKTDDLEMKAQYQKQMAEAKDSLKKLQTQHNTDSANLKIIEENKKTKAAEANKTTPQKGADQNVKKDETKKEDFIDSRIIDQDTCVSRGHNWKPDDEEYPQGTGKCIRSSFLSPSKEKLRQVAIHNLSNARDAEELMQLVKEVESIEFENYSRISYFEESDATLMKQISLKDIFSQIIPQAHAIDVGKVVKGVSGVGGAVKILPEVKKIFNTIKFGKGGEPISKEQLGSLKIDVENRVTKFIASPGNRIALNGVLMGWVGFMTLHMGNQAKASVARAEKLRSMKEDFKGGVGIISCTEAQRADPEKPSCYCYTSENKINPARSSKEVCKSTLVNLSKTKKDIESSGSKTCITQNLSTDPSCACRSNNTCLKATTGLTTTGFSPNTFKMISAGSAPSTDLFNGITSGADVADSAGINAARIKEASDAMLAKLDPKAAKDAKAEEAAMEKALLTATSGMSLPSGSGVASLPSSPAAAAAALDKELKENNEEIEVTDSGTPDSSTGTFADEPVPEFGMTEADSESQAIEISEVMGKEIDFKDHDVRKDPEVNIFDTLHGLYQTKGRQKLQIQPEPAEAPATAP